MMTETISSSSCRPRGRPGARLGRQHRTRGVPGAMAGRGRGRRRTGSAGRAWSRTREATSTRRSAAASRASPRRAIWRPSSGASTPAPTSWLNRRLHRLTAHGPGASRRRPRVAGWPRGLVCCGLLFVRPDGVCSLLSPGRTMNDCRRDRGHSLVMRQPCAFTRSFQNVA